jgi:hypothetical protein
MHPTAAPVCKRKNPITPSPVAGIINTTNDAHLLSLDRKPDQAKVQKIRSCKEEIAAANNKTIAATEERIMATCTSIHTQAPEMQKIALAQYRFELPLMTTKVSVCMVQFTAEGGRIKGMRARAPVE